MDRREMVGLIGSLGFGLVLTGRTWADGRRVGKQVSRPAPVDAGGRAKATGQEKPVHRK